MSFKKFNYKMEIILRYLNGVGVNYSLQEMCRKIGCTIGQLEIILFDLIDEELILYNGDNLLSLSCKGKEYIINQIELTSCHASVNKLSNGKINDIEYMYIPPKNL